MVYYRLVCSCALVVLVCSTVRPQTSVDAARDVSSLREEIRSLRHAIDSVRTVLKDQSYLEQDVLDLERLLDEKMRELESKVDAATRSTSQIVFNPRTTAFMNFAGRADNHTVTASSGIADVDNRMFLRSVEVDLRAPVDPYAEAVTILSLEDEAGTGYAIDVEEAYGIIKRLPLLESAPLGLKWKIGKFRLPFGQSNMLHLHDLPWTTRPLPVVLFLGTEHGPFFESGTNPVGTEFTFFVPSPIPGMTMEANADLIRGGNLGISEGHPGGKAAGMGHFSLSGDWNNEHQLVVGVSGYAERGPSPTALYGGDLLYRWAPAEGRATHSLVLGGEVFFADHEYDDPMTGRVRTKPWGWYAYAQYQASYRWYFGARYDWVQNPGDTRLLNRVAAVYASYYTTEFLRFRVGVEQSRLDPVSGIGLISGMFEVNLVYGSHPIEPYWVSR